MGRVVDHDGIPNALGVLDAIAAGAPWDQADIPGEDTTATVHDIRAYYEKAALELVDGPPPGARQAETWFYETTEAGRTVRAAQHAMQSAGAPLAVSFYMGPGHR